MADVHYSATAHPPRCRFNFESLDAFVAGLIKKGIVGERRALGRFRAAVVISAKLAHAFERSDREANEVIYRARDIAKKLAAIDPAKHYFPEAATHLASAKQIYELYGTLPIANWKRTDRFRYAFVYNLAFYWRRLTGRRPPKSGSGFFVNFVEHAFDVVGIEVGDVGRSVRQIIGRF